MRTDDLICMMAKAPPCCCVKNRKRVWASVVSLFVIMAVIVKTTLGFRPELADVLHNPDMLFKYAALAAATVGGGLAWWYSGHPNCSYRVAYYGLFALGGLLTGDVIYRLVSEPADVTSAAVFDYTAYVCVGFITAFALLGTVSLVRIGKLMAPTNCNVHAFMTAFFAASLGALAYGLHCPHDHPLYLEMWYAGTIVVFTLLARKLIAKKQSW